MNHDAQTNISQRRPLEITQETSGPFPVDPKGQSGPEEKTRAAKIEEINLANRGLLGCPKWRLVLDPIREKSFWRGVDKNGPVIRPGLTPCWVATTRKSGGYFQRNVVHGFTMHAHRAAYLMFYGEIPSGKYICHTCDNQLCINPDHLWAGTNSENILDAIKKGRQPTGLQWELAHRATQVAGESHPCAKLKTAQVLEIRRRYQSGEKCSYLAKEYGIGRNHALVIATKKVWKSVP